MGLLDVFKRKEPAKKRHSFTDDDRMLSAEKRKLKQRLDLEILKLETTRDKLSLQAEIEQATQELQELRGDYDDEEPSGSSVEDTLITTLLTKVLSGQQQTTSSQVSPTLTTSSVAPLGVEMSNEQLETIWGSLPKKQQKIAKDMDDEQLKQLIKGQIPNVNDDTLVRAIGIVRS